MKTTTHNHTDKYNNEVRMAYDKILKLVTRHIATVERHDLRCTLQRRDDGEIGFGHKVHELVSPIIYLSLECNDGELLSIHWGFEQFDERCEFSAITAQFIRSIFSFTALEHTSWNIQQCVHTDYVVTNCSELFEVIEDGNRYHTYKVIPYKAMAKKKSLRAVA